MHSSAFGDACLLLFSDHVVSINPDLTVCLCVTVPRAAPTGLAWAALWIPFDPCQGSASCRLQVTSQLSALTFGPAAIALTAAIPEDKAWHSVSQLTWAFH